MAEEEHVDECLANAGYDVRPSDLRHVANRLERLEMVLDGGAAHTSGVTHLATNAVHYNPSDLGGWIDSMLKELSDSEDQDHHSGGDDCPTFELAEAGEGFLDQDQNFSSSPSTDENSCKRVRLEPQTSPQNTNGSDHGLEDYVSQKTTAQPYFELDDHVAGSSPPEESATSSGVRLVHALMACGEAIHRSNLRAAEETLSDVKSLAAATGGAMAKVAQYFSEAITRRIYGFPTQDPMYLKNDSLSELLDIHFYETCPYLKFAHFTANQAILEAFQGHKRVHVIDFSLKQGVQWPALIQALALRPGGPPALRLTGIGPPQPDGKDVLHGVGIKLAQLADSVNVEFDFRGYVTASLSDIKPWMLDVRTGEILAVNSIFQLHSLLFSPDSNPPPIDEVLLAVRALSPKIMTLVEQEACHNSSAFLERFTEALHYYSTMFDSLEARQLPAQSYQQLMSEMYMARGICNIVACEGAERVERHEALMTWRLRMHNAGFRSLHLGSNAFKQASMLLTLFSGGEGYRVEEKNGCLTLGWHTRPLIAVSAWQCS